MEELFASIVELCNDMTSAVASAADGAIQLIPRKVWERFRSENTLLAGTGRMMEGETLESYLNGVNVEVNASGQVVIELDADQWLPNALEEGVRPWNMMDTHMKSGYKISKKGYRYKVIPMRVKPGKNNPRSGDNSNAFQAKLTQAIKKNKTGEVGSWEKVSRHLMAPTSKVSAISRFVPKSPTDRQFLNGLYKFDTYRDLAHASMQNAKPSKSRYILFRTMTNDPTKGIGKWEHPGIIARELFPKVQAWLEQDFAEEFEKLLESAFGKIME